MERSWIIAIVVVAIIAFAIRVKTYRDYQDRIGPYMAFYKKLIPLERELVSFLVATWRVPASDMPPDMTTMAMRSQLVVMKNQVLRMAVPNAERKVHVEFLRLMDTLDRYLQQVNLPDIDQQLEESVRSFQSAKGERMMDATDEDNYQTNIGAFFFGHKGRYLHE